MPLTLALSIVYFQVRRSVQTAIRPTVAAMIDKRGLAGSPIPVGVRAGAVGVLARSSFWIAVQHLTQSESSCIAASAKPVLASLDSSPPLVVGREICGAID